MGGNNELEVFWSFLRNRANELFSDLKLWRHILFLKKLEEIQIEGIFSKKYKMGPRVISFNMFRIMPVPPAPHLQEAQDQEQ